MTNVTVGEGNLGNSWIVVRGYNYENEDRFSISQNGKSYFIGNWYLNMDATIAKNTPQGEHLADMIERNSSVKVVKEWITNALLPLANPVDLRNRINSAISQAEKKGRQKKRDEIMQVLSCE